MTEWLSLHFRGIKGLPWTKLVEVMEFQLSYFKSWKMMLWKCCTQHASKFGKLSSGHKTGKGQFSFQSQREVMPKNAQTTAQLHSSHTPFQYSCLENPMDRGPWWAAVHGVAKSWTWLGDFTFTFHFHALEKEMATHSSVLAWRIPGKAGPSGLLSMGSHRVGHDWSNLAAANASKLMLGYKNEN